MVDIKNIQTKIKFTKNMAGLIRYAIEKALCYNDVKQRSVSVVICDDNYIQGLNKQYRDMDCPTDVLSFPLYDENGNLDGDELGDIVISVETANRQAIEYGHSPEREIAFLTVHSVLHLLGYDHTEDETIMFTMQKEIMESINNKISPKTKKICHSFKFAFSGMWFCIKNERNFRFHLFAALTVSLIAPYYKFITVEKILLVFVITTVLISEMFNTAIEAFIDAQTKKYITFAKVAKDVSAGAVLLAAICAIVCGLFLFLKVDIIHNILTDIFTSIPKIIATIIYFSAGYVFISKGGRNIS